jgi:hypothetical protein
VDYREAFSDQQLAISVISLTQRRKGAKRRSKHFLCALASWREVVVPLTEEGRIVLDSSYPK